MIYKLLLLDLDDTLTPNLGMPPTAFVPSQNLLQTISESHRRIAISLCTGRDKKTVLDVVKTLELTTPQIIEAGSKIIDTSGNTLWVQYIEKESVNMICSMLKNVKKSFSIIVDGEEIMDTIPTDHLDKIAVVFWYDLSLKETELLYKQLSIRKDLHISHNTDRTGNTLSVTHALGTKSHGVRKLLDLLHVKKEEVIGVGDGNNDKPLLLGCGLKIAMGNATDELKRIADYVAPSVDDDGIVDVLYKFVLKKTGL